MIIEAQKKPVKIKAIQFTGKNSDEVLDFCGSRLVGLIRQFETESVVDALIIYTPEGDMKASIGDYVIRGVKGECYPCKPDIFELTYDILPADQSEPEKAHDCPWKTMSNSFQFMLDVFLQAAVSKEERSEEIISHSDIIRQVKKTYEVCMRYASAFEENGGQLTIDSVMKIYQEFE